MLCFQSYNAMDMIRRDPEPWLEPTTATTDCMRMASYGDTANFVNYLDAETTACESPQIFQLRNSIFSDRLVWMSQAPNRPPIALWSPLFWTKLQSVPFC